MHIMKGSADLAESEDLPLKELVATKQELARRAYSLFSKPVGGEEVVSVPAMNQIFWRHEQETRAGRKLR